MAVIDELLRSESNGSISFGNHELAAKAKLEDYEHSGGSRELSPCFSGILVHFLVIARTE